MKALIVAASAGAAALLSFACEDRGIEEQQVDEGVEQIAPEEEPGRGESPGQEATPASGETAWTAPEGWSEVEESRPMRLATFEVDDGSGLVEVSLTRFPGDVGGVLANVNRWRGQVGLEPIGEDELEENIERLGDDDYPAYLVRAENDDVALIAVGVYEASDDRTWFVKTIVPAEAADRLEPQLVEFAGSIGPGG